MTKKLELHPIVNGGVILLHFAESTEASRLQDEAKTTAKRAQVRKQISSLNNLSSQKRLTPQRLRLSFPNLVHERATLGTSF